MDIKINSMDFIWLVRPIDKMLTDKIITQIERNTMISEIATEQNLPMIYL